MTGEMNIIIGERKNTRSPFPRAPSGTATRCWRRDHGRVRQVTVKTGFHTLERTEILDGLNEGDQVILSNQDLYKPGVRVREVTEKSAVGPDAPSRALALLSHRAPFPARAQALHGPERARRRLRGRRLHRRLRADRGLREILHPDRARFRGRARHHRPFPGIERRHHHRGQAGRVAHALASKQEKENIIPASRTPIT